MNHESEMERGQRGAPRPGAQRRKPLWWRHALLSLVLAACGGTVGTRMAGGESHFLGVCAQSCAGGLDCIDNVCTRLCAVDSADCKDLAPNAQCVERSIQPGEVSVCDVACERDGDCASLAGDFGCFSGYCRAESLEPPGGGAGSGPAQGRFNDDHCEVRGQVQSQCSFEETCALLHCGDGFSQFGADGCTRYCDSDADCGNGERCRHTALAITEDSCPSLGSEVEACELSEGRCSCSITADCTHPAVCVDAQAYPSSQDCVVQGVTCTQLEEALFRARALVQEGGEQAAMEAAACLVEIDAERVELGCEPDPNGPFVPACEVPLEFESDCGFTETCGVLGCGDGVSPFDARGCTRYCATSVDCAAGERCRSTRLFLSEEECPSLGSEVEGCTFTEGACQCSTTADCVHPDVCVDAVEYPASLDCAVEDASCAALELGELRLQEFLDTAPAPDAAAEARTCLDAIRAQQEAMACSG